jgi:hypothetical protein
MASETNTMPVPETAAASNDNTGGDVNPSPVEQGKPETDNLPSIDLQRKVENYPVFDRTGKEHPFKSLYSGSDSARRVLVIFVRHFFCGVSFSTI